MFPLIVFLALFLLLLAALTLASIRLFSVKGPDGSVAAPGCLAGCATACALCFIALVGLVAFGVGVAAIVSLDTVRHSPIESVGVWADPHQRVHHDPERPLHIVVEWSGHSEPDEELMKIVNDVIEGEDVNIQVDYTTNDQGEEISVADISMHADADDIAELEESLRGVFHDVDLSKGLQLRLRGARRD